MSGKVAQFEILPAADFNEVQALLMMELTSQNEPNLNIVSVINSCGWPISIRIICDDLDIGENELGAAKMCHFSFSTKHPNETLVFCQTWGQGRTLSFDVWGGTAPRGLNVWSLLPDVEMGLALNGTIRKGWSVTDCVDPQDLSDISDETEEDEDEEYFHKTPSSQTHFIYPNATGGGDARVPSTEPELII